MNYNIKGSDIEITDELRTYAEKKLSVFDKMFGNNTAARVDIVLAHLANEERKYHAEMTLHDAKYPLHAESYGSSLHEALDVTAAELESELTKAKKKKLSNFRHSAVNVKEFLRGWRRKI